MRIVIDARMYKESGIGRYIRNLISHLENFDKKNDYFILHLKSDYDTLEYYSNFENILAGFKWYGISEQIKLPKLLNKLKPDLVHFPHFNVPFFYDSKFVVTIHDLIHQHFSMARATTHDPITYKFKQFGYKRVFQHAIKKSLKIFTPSNFVKRQLINEWNIDAGKITITPEAVDDKIPSIVNNLSTKMTEPYIFYVGNAHPHKNVEGLIKAFLLIVKKYPKLNLVLSGYDHYFWQRIKNEYKHKDIIYTGYVSEEKLVTLYKNALLFVMPSFEEGFGIPILEAMACGCPVVSSNTGALPEVGGDAAFYFDPKNMIDMGDKIDRVLQSEKLRKELIEKGKKRVRKFSWEKLAQQTLEGYLQCV